MKRRQLPVGQRGENATFVMSEAEQLKAKNTAQKNKCNEHNA
jgi:hypothetical protein